MLLDSKVCLGILVKFIKSVVSGIVCYIGIVLCCVLYFKGIFLAERNIRKLVGKYVKLLNGREPHEAKRKILVHI